MQLLRADLSCFIIIKIARWTSKFNAKEANFDLKNVCVVRERLKSLDTARWRPVRVKLWHTMWPYNNNKKLKVGLKLPQRPATETEVQIQ